MEPTIRNYELDELGRRAHAIVRHELRNQLRQADLKPPVFMAILASILRLLQDPVSGRMPPLARLRDLTQGIMQAFVDKKMQAEEGARVVACGAVLFHPRGVAEQLDVARHVACELILTRINLGTEMVQVSQGIGRAFTTLLGLATLLPGSLNGDTGYLEELYGEFRTGIWLGTMVAADRSTIHGNRNLEQFEAAHRRYAEGLLQRTVSGKARSVLGSVRGS